MVRHKRAQAGDRRRHDAQRVFGRAVGAALTRRSAS